MSLSVIVCTYNRSASLRKVLSCLNRLTLPAGMSCEVIIVDNNSNDDTRSTVEAITRERRGFFKYVFEARQGKSFALNKGISVAQGNIIAFTDDDVELDTEWLVEISRVFESYDCAAVGGKTIAVWTSPKPYWYEEAGPYRLLSAIVKLDLGESPCELKIPPPGANVAFRRNIFEKYGLFREDLGPNSTDLIRGEDAEFCWRVIHGGEKFIYAPRAIVYHPVERSRTKKEYFQAWYYDQGRASVRMEGIPEGTLRYLGVPRYFVRNFFEVLVKWACSFDTRRRFFYKLKLIQIAGQITESRLRPKSAE